MADPISAAGGMPASHNLSLFDLPHQADPNGFVSNIGDNALARVEAMQESFRANAADMDSSPEASSSYFQTEAVEPASRAETTLSQAVEGLEHSMKMQAELAQFVMLSSVTSAFGKNLNSFLRGQ